MSLLQMSFSGAILIFVVLVIRAVAINRLPKKGFLVLWGIVFFKLLIPFSIPSVFSIHSFIRQRAATTFDELPLENAIQIISQEQIGTIQEKHTLSTSFITSIWCIGMIFCVMFFVLSYLRCQFEFKTSLPVCNDFATQWLKKHPVKRPISIRQSDKISSPLTYGFFRPVILMPKKLDWNNLMQLQYILLHEYLHICHYDIVIKLISAIVLCIHWFNPMVWIMYIFLNRDIELVCDESVVKLSGMNIKSSYARILIDMEEQKSGLAPLCNNFSKNAMEERITAIMKTKKTTKITIILTGFIILGTTGIFATSAYASQSQQAESIEQNDKNEYKFLTDSETTDVFGIDLPEGNIIYFNTKAEFEEHLNALEANNAKGLNRYAGFEDIYKDVDTSIPIIYMVKSLN